jgi:FixJ family two-component response regulator
MLSELSMPEAYGLKSHNRTNDCHQAAGPVTISGHSDIFP